MKYQKVIEEGESEEELPSLMSFPSKILQQWVCSTAYSKSNAGKCHTLPKNMMYLSGMPGNQKQRESSRQTRPKLSGEK